jgi:hypothetical protein
VAGKRFCLERWAETEGWQKGAGTFDGEQNMNRHIVIICFLLSIGPSLCAQRLWDHSVPWQDYIYVGSDTSVQHLRQMILEKSSDDNRIARNAAIDILACSGGESQKDFLLDALQMAAPVDSLGSPSPSWFQWSDYLTYQSIRGYYGEAGAITGMDSIAQLAPDSRMKFHAVAYLAKARIFRPEYFEMLKSAFERAADFHTAAIIADYGSDQQYRAEAGDLLESMIHDSIDVRAYSGARDLATFDQPRAAASLEGRFQALTGSDRYLCFVVLRQIDSSGQARRSMWAIPREPDDQNRSLYFPSYGGYEAVTGERVNFSPKGCYLTPEFVKFTKDWLTHESSDFPVTRVRETFLDVFIPFVPPPSESVSQLLDSLVEMKHQISTFDWLADQAFVAELDADLMHARQSLQSGDSIGCARAVKFFQNKVDVVHGDWLHPDPRMVTEEGWKFLHYNAQYVLDRLPQLSKPGR